MLTIELINAKRSLVDRYFAWSSGGTYRQSYSKDGNKIIQVWYNSPYPFLEVLLHEFGHYISYNKKQWTRKEILKEIIMSFVYPFHDEDKANAFEHAVFKKESISIKINEPIRIILKE